MAVAYPSNGDNELRLLVIGKTSEDNDGTVSTILGRYDMDYVHVRIPTKVVSCKGDLLGKKVSVVNTPGLMTVRGNCQPKDIKAEVTKIVKECEKGFNAVLVTVSYPIRWTQEEIETAKYVMDIIGEENITKCGFLIITDIKGITKKRTTDEVEQYFRTYIPEQMASLSANDRYFFNLFNGRHIFLDNQDYQNANKQQLLLLRDMINPRISFSIKSTGLSLQVFWDLLYGLWTWSQNTYSRITNYVWYGNNQPAVRNSDFTETQAENGFTKVTLEEDLQTRNMNS